MGEWYASLFDEQIYNLRVFPSGSDVITVPACGYHIIDFEVILYCKGDALLVNLQSLFNVHVC